VTVQELKGGIEKDDKQYQLEYSVLPFIQLIPKTIIGHRIHLSLQVFLMTN